MRQPRQNNNTLPAGAFVLPEAPDKAIKAMISVVGDLHSVYEQETEALKASNVRDFSSLQRYKIEAAQRYQSGITQVIARKGDFDKVDPALRKRLKDMQREFTSLAHNNEKALVRMQRATQRLTETVRNAARKAVEQNSATSYGQNGSLTQKKNGPLSVGIQETV